MTLLVMPTNAHDMVQKNLEEIIVDNVEIGNQGGIEVEIEHITGVGAVANDLDKLGLSFYGHHERVMHDHSWALLRQLCSIRFLPWLVLGDFNEITSLDEKLGRVDRNLSQMATFRESQLWVTSWLIESKKAQLVMLEKSSMDEYSSSEVNMLRREVNVLVEKEEIFWRQQSHVAWLKEGDRNTQFYHVCASLRKKANRIRGFRDDQDVWQTDSLAINNIAVDYFHHLFDSSRPDCKMEVVD
uniref:Endonuclease/exonuclease/phosphatase domain-containing protein n=1 Tax=Fagus sylvatica TaxID=28930 RepID=A0A2N9F8D3_FAGSY